MSARDPDAILAELGHDLRAAWARPPRRARFARWPRGLVLVLALLALVPTALATRDAIWAPDPAPLPDARPPGSFAPSERRAVSAAGAERGVAWRLTASACDYGQVRAVGVFLTVPGGGEGRVAMSPAGARRRRARASSRGAWCRPTRSRVGRMAFGAAGGGANRRRDERDRAHARRRDAGGCRCRGQGRPARRDACVRGGPRRRARRPARHRSRRVGRRAAHRRARAAAPTDPGAMP